MSATEDVRRAVKALWATDARTLVIDAALAGCPSAASPSTGAANEWQGWCARRTLPTVSQYILDLGASLAHVLEHARSAQPEMFAGHVANLAFWLDEYDHLCTVHAGYDARLEQMKQASTRFLASHGRRVHNFDDVGDPYQKVHATTKPRERDDAIRACRNALLAIVERALDLDLMELDAVQGARERITRYRL